ncbi:RNase H family protein [Paenibacillus xylaniclasticus]|uniref:RNase H family protein n=1 Tax=Paenibacillus xylaniclasticus TaxID=588083 RepID=UPI001FE59F67|nr:MULTISPECIES: RNase H family protein [Paenibacillus]
MFLYCDYAGFASQNLYGAACTLVYHHNIKVTAKKLPIECDRGSNYGEMMAIIHSLETLSAALMEHRPKSVVIYTDCSRITHLLVQERFSHSHDEQGRNQLIDVLAVLRRRFSEVNIRIQYMRKHKDNNTFHRLAHNAAREAALNEAMGFITRLQ